jgi:hypothetical protein
MANRFLPLAWPTSHGLSSSVQKPLKLASVIALFKLNRELQSLQRRAARIEVTLSGKVLSLAVEVFRLGGTFCSK